jgi:hypothetical protein
MMTTLQQIDRRYDRKLDRFFACASFPTAASEAEFKRIEDARQLEKARAVAPRLVKKTK